MCAIYFASHRACAHKHFLGSFNCGCNCPFDMRHLFYIEDAGDANDCATCEHVEKRELDPDVVPVKWYAPTQDYGAKIVRDGGVARVEKVDLVREIEKEEKKKEEMEGGGEEEKVHAYHPSPASLSDPDSDTETWKLSPPARSSKLHPTHKHAHVDEASGDENDPFTDSPDTLKHRDLVQEQLNQLPSVFLHGQYAGVIQPAQSGFYKGQMGGWYDPGRTVVTPTVAAMPPKPPKISLAKWNRRLRPHKF